MADKYLEKKEKLRQKEKAKFEKEKAKWLKEEARKRKKKTLKVDVGALVFKITAIVLAAAIALGLTAYFAVSYGYPGRVMPALSVGSKTVYEPEWAFMFYNEYSNQYQTAVSYSQMYGIPVGISTTESAFGLTYSETDGNTVTWDEKLQEMTNETLQKLYIGYAEAMKLGLEMSEEAKQEIEDSIAEIEGYAKQNQVSFNAYLRMTGNPPGVTKRTYRNMYEREAYANAFETHKKEEIRAQFTDEVLAAEYAEDTAAYDFVDFRSYAFAKSTLEANEGESAEALAQRQAASDLSVKQAAEGFLAKVKDEASFLAAAEEQEDSESYDAASETELLRIRKSSLDSYYVLDLEEEHEEPEGDEEHVHEQDLFSDWAYAAQRKAGDYTLFEADNYFYVVYLTKPAYQLNTLDFYTINIAYESVEEDSEATAANQAEALDNANAVLTAWEAAGGNEEAFIAQINEHGTPTEEGEDLVAAALSESMAPGNAGVTALDNWLFAPGRKAGEATVIDAGSNSYKVVFLKSLNKDEYTWKGEITETHASEDFEAHMEELKEQYPLKEKSAGIWFGRKTAQSLCDAYLAYQKSQSESSY